jgi:hypothetical protein
VKEAKAARNACGSVKFLVVVIDLMRHRATAGESASRAIDHDNDRGLCSAFDVDFHPLI